MLLFEHVLSHSVPQMIVLIKSEAIVADAQTNSQSISKKKKRWKWYLEQAFANSVSAVLPPGSQWLTAFSFVTPPCMIWVDTKEGFINTPVGDATIAAPCPFLSLSHDDMTRKTWLLTKAKLLDDDSLKIDKYALVSASWVWDILLLAAKEPFLCTFPVLVLVYNFYCDKTRLCMRLPCFCPIFFFFPLFGVHYNINVAPAHLHPSVYFSTGCYIHQASMLSTDWYQ